MELPFLYCTKTILRQHSKSSTILVGRSRKYVSNPAAISTEGNNDDALDRERTSFLRQKAQEVASSKPITSKSTITAAERRAFNDLLRLRPRSPASTPRYTSEDTSSTDHQNILSIFSGAIRGHVGGHPHTSKLADLPARKPQAPSPGWRSFSPSTTSTDAEPVLVERDFKPEEVDPARMAAMTRIAQQYLQEAAEDSDPQSTEDAVNEFTSEQMRLIAVAFDEALNVKDKSGDLALWDVLCSRIFPMVKLLATTGQPSYPAKSQHQPSNNAPRDSKAQNISKEASTQPPKAQASQPLIIPSSLPALPIVSRLYPASLLLALRLLCKHYPLSSLPTSLLPHIRSLGPASYVLGANTHFYNTLISHYWNVYSDLSYICELLGEMERGGVEMDKGTLQVLVGIQESSLKGDRRGLWWERRSVKGWMAGIGRWRAVLERRLEEVEGVAGVNMDMAGLDSGFAEEVVAGKRLVL